MVNVKLILRGNHPRSREEALGDEQRTHHCSVGLLRFRMPPPPPPLLQYTEGRGYWRPMAPVCPRHMDRRLLMAIRVVRKNIARFDRDQTDGQRAVLCVALSPSTRLPS
ncbi:hypothetical protein PRIPAC_96370, partial [Pristionchus pacificus]|uniref:Uncharacterized protein n=1 Tax=Pristionchus pacificus TaxID=54126 RepID=A0A2A6BK32_PRIPA